MATGTGHGRDPVPLLTAPAATDFVLTLWTDDAALAARADAAGVDRVGIDIERIGKAERQHGLGTWISPHEIDSLPAVRGALRSARLFARTNPLHRGSPRELEALLAAGVEVVMLPMFAGAGDVASFAEMVAGRAELVLLLERREAAEAIDEILEVDAVSEVHVGINDFSLDLGLPNRFLALTHHLTEHVGMRVRAAGRRFGVGAIGRAGDTTLPIDPAAVYAQYARLGATAALISRAFLRGRGVDLADEVAHAREALARWCREPESRLLEARDELARAAANCGCW